MHAPSEYELFEHLQGLETTGDPNQWTARCPAHDDTRNSLSVGIGEDGRKLVVNCHAGCSALDVLNSRGLTFGALYPKVDADAYFESQRRKRNGKPVGKIVKTYDYRNEQGELLYQACRMEPKDFRQRKPDGKGGWTWSMRGVSRVLYRLPEIVQSGKVTERDIPIIIVEGEKDADKLSDRNMVATTNVSGAGKWRSEYNETLRGRRVFILPDNDKAGKEHADHVARQLTGVATSVKIVNLTDQLPKKGDISDWLDAGGTEAKFIQACHEAEEYKPDAKPIELRYSIDDPHYLATLFLDQHRDKFKQEALTIRYWQERFYAWNGWNYCRLEVAEIRADVSNAIQREFEQDSIRKRQQSYDAENQLVKKVTQPIVSNVLDKIKSQTIVRQKEVPCWLCDATELADPHNIIPMENGLLDITRRNQNGEFTLLPSTPKFFCLNHCSYPYEPAAEGGEFLKRMRQNLRDDPESINTLCEFGGYCLTHSTDFHKFMILSGGGGNGKSVFLAALEATIGPENVSHNSLDTFGQRFGLEPLIGKTVNMVGDMDRIDQVAEGTLKSVVSGDPITIDRKGIQPITVSLPTKLIFSTNELPRMQDRSNGLWRRLIHIPFDNEVPEGERIKGMDKAEWWAKAGERPGIFNLFLEGLERLRSREGFTLSEKVRKSIAEYRRASNPAQRFLEEFYEADKDSFVLTQEIYKHYKSWCEEEGHRHMASNRFEPEIRKLFPGEKDRRIIDGQKRSIYWGCRSVACPSACPPGVHDDDADSFNFGLQFTTT